MIQNPNYEKANGNDSKEMEPSPLPAFVATRPPPPASCPLPSPPPGGRLPGPLTLQPPDSPVLWPLARFWFSAPFSSAPRTPVGPAYLGF